MEVDMKNLMLKMMMSALVMSSSVLASDKTPGLTEYNPNHNIAQKTMSSAISTGIFVAGRIVGTETSKLIGDAAFLTGQTNTWSDGYIHNQVANFTANMSDQAWDLMRFYDHHNIDISDRDDLHMRVAGCIIQ